MLDARLTLFIINELVALILWIKCKAFVQSS